MIDNNKIMREFYMEALNDFRNGESLENLKIILKHLEDEELYYECAGLKKAIDEIEQIVNREC